MDSFSPMLRGCTLVQSVWKLGTVRLVWLSNSSSTIYALSAVTVLHPLWLIWMWRPETVIGKSVQTRRANKFRTVEEGLPLGLLKIKGTAREDYFSSRRASRHHTDILSSTVRLRTPSATWCFYVNFRLQWSQALCDGSKSGRDHINMSPLSYTYRPNRLSDRPSIFTDNAAKSPTCHPDKAPKMNLYNKSYDDWQTTNSPRL